MILVWNRSFYKAVFAKIVAIEYILWFLVWELIY